MVLTLNVMESIWQAIGDAIRSLFFTIDKGLFKAFGEIFEMFFDLSRTTFLIGDIYSYIFRRVFIILSIFMMFKLMVSFLSYLLNPDALTDKERGFGKLIGRVVASLLFLIGLMPIGASNNYSTNFSTIDDNIDQQGIIFGTLQDIQDRIIENNIIGQLILGDVKVDSSNGKITEDEANNMGELIGLTTFASFYKIEIKSLNSDKTCAEDVNYGEPIEDPDTYRFSSWDDAEAYLFTTCDNEGYFIDFNPFMGFLVGLAVCVLAFLFTFDVVLRAMKLAILRLISPIPAISYINPKSAKDGTFAAYIKVLISTYLDLFLRIAIIYLVVLIISYLTTKNSGVISTSDNVGGLGNTIIIITLLFFAFQAPKFIKQALGIKDTGTGFGFGAALVGGALGGAASGFATGGLWGGVKGLVGGANAGAKNQWAAQMGQKPNMSARQAGLNRGAQLGSGDPNAKAGNVFGGGFRNLVTGATNKGLKSAKKSLSQAQQDLNDRQRIASNLGFGHNPTAEEWAYLAKQKYANGQSIVTKNQTTGAYEFRDSSNNIITNTADMASALAFDNSKLQTNIQKYQGDLDDFKKYRSTNRVADKKKVNMTGDRVKTFNHK